MFGLGIKEIVIIVLALLLLFGLTKFPALVKNLAESVKIVKRAFGRKDGEPK